jgi:hypothetical protein
MDLRKPEPVNLPGKKHTECPFYDCCLDQAVQSWWDWWSCGKCGNYVLNEVEKRLQYIGQHYGYLFQIYPELKDKYDRFLQRFRCQVKNISPADFHTARSCNQKNCL